MPDGARGLLRRLAAQDLPRPARVLLQAGRPLAQALPASASWAPARRQAPRRPARCPASWLEARLAQPVDEARTAAGWRCSSLRRVALPSPGPPVFRSDSRLAFRA